MAATLPPGTYYLECSGDGSDESGCYALTIEAVPAENLKTLPTDGIAHGNLLDAVQQTWAFALSTTSRVRVTASSAYLDPVLDLRLVTGGSLLRVEGRAPTSRAILDVDLPAGVYMLAVSGQNGIPGPYSLEVTRAPITLPELSPHNRHATATARTGSLRLFAVALDEPGVITLMASESGTPAHEKILSVHDVSLRLVACTHAAPSSEPVRLGVPLPAGNYRIGLRVLADTPVDVEVEFDRAPSPPLPRLEPGSQLGMLAAGDDCVTWELHVATVAPWDLELRGVGDRPLQNGTLTLLDGNDGRRIDFAGGRAAGAARVGALLAPGRYLVVARDAGGQGGTFELNVRAPLVGREWNGWQRLHGLAKHGDLLAMWVSPTEVQPVPLDSMGIEGFLQIDPNSARLVSASVAPRSGRIHGPLLPIGPRYFVQGAVWSLERRPIRLTNLVR
jgi:hypothetical protein